MTFAGVDVKKARALPAGVRASDVRDVAAAMAGILARQRDSVESQYAGVPLPRPPQWQENNFGPGYPLIGEPIDRPRPDTGQQDLRLTEYEVSWNIQLLKERHVSWETLKGAADSPLFRACIELRKNELQTQDWVIRVSPKAAARIARRSDKSKDAVANDLQKQYQDEIDRLTDWWEYPDRKNDQDFATWIGLCAEEQLVWDALSIYPHMTYGQRQSKDGLLGLWVVDGSTIKPLRDETGGRPDNPFPAYQQILYGFPRGEYQAQVFDREDGTKVVPGAIQANQLVYKRRVPRTWSPYGLSSTEQALMHGLLFNKRFSWMLAEYTEGVMPAQFIESDGQLDWTPTQLLDYERDFNMRLTGQTAERMRAPFLPPGLRAAAMAQVGERYKPEYDMYLVKLVAMHFMVTITELGFTETGGLGSTGYHEGQEDIQFRKARLPDLKWYGQLCTQISRAYLRMPDELEFSFLGLDDDDEAAADAIDHQRLADARMTLNELRMKIGLPPLPFKEANMVMLQTARGVVFLDGSSQTVPAGVLVEPASEQVNTDPGAPGGGTAQSPSKRRPIAPGGNPAPKSKTPTAKSAGNDSEAAIAELMAWYRWAQKHPEPGRPFECKHMTAQFAKDMGDSSLLTDDRIVFVKDARANEVVAQLAEDYPPEQLTWIPNAKWTGPHEVPLDEVDWSGRENWRAYDQPQHAAKFVKKAKKGKRLKPVVLIQRPGNPKQWIADGHHRSLASAITGVPVWAWTAHVTDKTGPWVDMHANQKNGTHSATASTDGPDGTTAERAEYQQAIEDGLRACGDEWKTRKAAGGAGPKASSSSPLPSPAPPAGQGGLSTSSWSPY